MTLHYLAGDGQLIPMAVVAAAFVITLFFTRRIMPAQNVLAAVVIIGVVSALVEALGARTGIPFGPFFYTGNFGPLLLHLLPWPVPLIWVVAILNSRGVARLILRPWREAPNYGIYVLALSCLLVVVCDVNLEPFAARTNHFWIWQTRRSIPGWYGAPWINFPAWGAVTLLILGVITPWLINKMPGPEPPPDFAPLGPWVVLNLLLTACNAFNHLWAAVILGLLGVGTVLTTAWRHSRGG